MWCCVNHRHERTHFFSAKVVTMEQNEALDQQPFVQNDIDDAPWP